MAFVPDGLDARAITQFLDNKCLFTGMIAIDRSYLSGIERGERNV